MKKSIAIIGGGPSSLMLAAHLDTRQFDVTIYERNYAVGRKFLVAGDGGFNLTHSEAPELLIHRYTPSSFLFSAIHSFNNTDFRNWLHKIGIDTYTGSSKRVFPMKGIKPIVVLNSILNELTQKKVVIKNQYEWKGWTEKNELLFIHADQENVVKPDITVFALGGASWKITGSDGYWVSYFNEKNIATLPFQPSNCAYQVEWPDAFLSLAEGKSLKNIAIRCGSLEKKGEIVITRLGMEGGAIYALSSVIRKQMTTTGYASVLIDLKPALSAESIATKLKQKGRRSISQCLQQEININDVQLALLKSLLSKEEFTNPLQLASGIKQLPIRIIGFAPIDEAISVVGGIDLNEVDPHCELKKLPHHFAIGEMLDWDAPTGGYLLQACFSMGFFLAKHLNNGNV